MIVTYIITGAFVILSLVVQSHPSFDVIRIAGVKPDLLFIIIVYMAYCFGSFYGEVVGFIGGLLQDAASNSLLGLMTFPKVALGLIIGMFGRSVIKSNIITITLLLFIATLVKGLITLFMSYIFHTAHVSEVLTIILPEAFYNALLAPPIFFILDKVFQRELEQEGYL